MTQKAPVVNEPFVQALKREREQLARSVPVKSLAKRPASPVQRMPAPIRQNMDAGSKESALHGAELKKSFSGALSPTLTLEVARATPEQRAMAGVGVATTGARRAMSGTATAGVKPVAKRSARAGHGKTKLQRIAEPKEGMMRSAWRVLFGLFMGVNIAVSSLIALAVMYAVITGGDIAQWVAFK